MPKMHFTDTNLAAIAHGTTTWYSHKSDNFAGLRLCVTKTAKTWYASKWDVEAQKTRAVKLGRFPAWPLKRAWSEAQAVIGKIDTGEFNKPDANAPLPTFDTQFEAYLAYHRVDRKNGTAPLRPRTEADYRSTINRHFSKWRHLPLDQIDGRAASKAMDDLQARHPYVAQHLHVIVGAVFKFDPDLGVAPPRGLRIQTKMQPREIDRTIEWSDRVAEVEGIDNKIKRLCWLLRWHTGSRENVLRELTWDRVDLDKGTMTFDRLKRDERGRTIALSDTSWGMFKRLNELRVCDYVFPSMRRTRKDGRLVYGHLDYLDRLPLTSPGDLRHLWHDAAMIVGTPLYMMRWLNGQNLKAGEVSMLGHYGRLDDIDAQRVAANKISDYIASRCEVEPSNLLEFNQARVL